MATEMQGCVFFRNGRKPVVLNNAANIIEYRRENNDIKVITYSGNHFYIKNIFLPTDKVTWHGISSETIEDNDLIVIEGLDCYTPQTMYYPDWMEQYMVTMYGEKRIVHDYFSWKITLPDED